MAKYNKDQVLEMLNECANAARPLIYSFPELKGKMPMTYHPDQRNAFCAISGNMITQEHKLFFSLGFALFNKITKGFTAPFVVGHELGHYKNAQNEFYAQLYNDKPALYNNEFMADKFSVDLCKKLGYKFVVTRAVVYLVGSMIYALGWIRGIKCLLSKHPDEDHPHPLLRIWKLL